MKISVFIADFTVVRLTSILVFDTETARILPCSMEVIPQRIGGFVVILSGCNSDKPMCYLVIYSAK